MVFRTTGCYCDCKTFNEGKYDVSRIISFVALRFPNQDITEQFLEHVYQI